MLGQRLWVQQGKIVPLKGAQIHYSHEEEERMLQSGSVRLTTGELGTEVKWHVTSPCVASLFTAMQWVAGVRAPFILRFFAVGWFEEVYREPAAAVARMEQVLARGDRHFTGRVFIQQATLESALLPDVLKAALEGQPVPPDYAVDCTYDENSHAFRVDRVGAKSAIGRVWGTFTTSHPCQSEGSYGDPVNATYDDVLRTGKPRYDHVLAALRLPDNALHWVPYHRVVFPKRTGRNEHSVEVISQIARVDIQVL
jgi:hypothetical protein